MLHFEGERTFPLPPTELWAKLRDAGFLVTCIPDATVKGEPQRDKAVCTVHPGFAFVSGTLDTTVEILAANEPTDLRFLLSSKGIGTCSEVESTLTIGATDNGSRVHWVADVKRLGGLLKAVPSGLISGAAKKIIDDVWAEIGKKVIELRSNSD
jgi:carbon monoxide dehydrogenase subunit G